MTAAPPEGIEASAQAETVEAAKPIGLAEADPPEPVAPVRPIEEPQSEQPVATADIPSLPQRVAETPSPAKRGKSVEKRRPETSSKPAKRVEREAKALSSGSHGEGTADQRRGRAEGAENGQKAVASRGSAASAEGNAAVSNYPGKIVRKLRRALRYPTGAGSRRLRGVAEVRFVISSGGGVGGIQLVASSGSPILDKAALEAVRRAAPFPPIPAEAGRSNWPFTVPLAFVR
jgi:protein TonB